MSFLLRIDQDLKAALRQSDSLRLSVLRMMKSALTYRRIELKRELTEEDVHAVLTTLVKQRQESAAQYDKGGRPELAEKERQEIGIIRAYLPEQLSSETLDRLIGSAIAQAGACGEADMGSVMKVLMPNVKGRADGKAVNARVRELIAALPR